MMNDDDVVVARASGRETVEELRRSGALDALFERLDAGEVEMTGSEGLLPALLKEALERGLAAELTEHLGYEKGQTSGQARSNTRNGTTKKTVISEVGAFEIEVPRDRAGSFTPRLVRKGQRRLDGLDSMIISLYAGGMTVRDIRHHLASTLGVEVSAGTISTITDAVCEAVLDWQHRPLEAFYPVIYLDAIRIKVRCDHRVENRAAHLAVGVDMEGVKHVLGIWVQADEGASFWAHVCAELANRGLRDVLIVCCDGLAGLPEAIEATWPQSMVQTCVVHLIRASMRFVSYKDRKSVAAALKRVYSAPNEETARGALEDFAASDLGGRYPPNGCHLAARLAALHAVLGVPAHAAPRRVHHQRYRVLELPATQDHQEPRAFPQRRSRRQTLVARHLQHRRQTSRPAPRRRWQTPQQTNRTHPPHPRTHHHQLETSPRPTHHRLPRPNHPLPLTPIHRKIDRLNSHAIRIPELCAAPQNVAIPTMRFQRLKYMSGNCVRHF